MTTQYNTLRELDVRQGDVVRWRHGHEYKIFGWKDGKCYHFGNDVFPCSVELDAAMRGWSIVSRAPDMIPRAQADAMVAAALTEAAEIAENAYHHADDGTSDPMSPEGIADNIRALITDDAQTALAKLLAEAKEQKQPAISETPTPAQVEDACLSYDHSFGLMGAEQADLLRWRCKEWWRCIARANAIQKEGKA